MASAQLIEDGQWIREAELRRITGFTHMSVVKAALAGQLRTLVPLGSTVRYSRADAMKLAAKARPGKAS